MKLLSTTTPTTSLGTRLGRPHPASRRLLPSLQELIAFPSERLLVVTAESASGYFSGEKKKSKVNKKETEKKVLATMFPIWGQSHPQREKSGHVPAPGPSPTRRQGALKRKRKKSKGNKKETEKKVLRTRHADREQKGDNVPNSGPILTPKHGGGQEERPVPDPGPPRRQTGGAKEERPVPNPGPSPTPKHGAFSSSF